MAPVPPHNTVPQVKIAISSSGSTAFLPKQISSGQPEFSGLTPIFDRTTKTYPLAGGTMNKFFASLIVLAAMALPALAQGQQMSPDDQQKFDNYYSRWVQDKQNSDRDDMVSSEHHMQDLMNKYSIPADTPYDQIASQNNMAPPPPGYDNRGYNTNPA